MPETQDSTILLCEPHCLGFAHAPVNAALIETVLLAYPEVHVVFLAEQEHLSAVRAELASRCSSDPSRVRWEPIRIPNRSAGLWNAMREEWTFFDRLSRMTAEQGARYLLLSMIADSSLLALKVHMYLGHVSTPVFAVMHGPLSTVATVQSDKRWRRFANLRQVLRLPHPKSLRFIALGDSILRCLTESMPSAARHFSSLELSYLWTAHEAQPVGDPSPVRFGYFGVNSRNKGFDTFHRLAVDIRRETSNAEFVMVGFVRSPDDCAKYREAVSGVGETPLDRDEFAARAASITYAVWTGDPRHYGLTASGSFLDALSHVKPGVYLRNPYIEYYFGKMGDIGYLCDSYDEMRDQLQSLATEFPKERYARQCVNIIQGRGLFEPTTLAPKLRAIMDAYERTT